jgi:hypothetical protein
MRQDQEVRDLAEALKNALALVETCPGLRKINGATDVIQEMGRAAMDAASLIDEYARSPFIGNSNV